MIKIATKTQQLLLQHIIMIPSAFRQNISTMSSHLSYSFRAAGRPAKGKASTTR
jgi:hypothetical protein